MKWRKSDESEVKSTEDIILDSIVMDEEYNAAKNNDDSFEIKLNDDVFALSEADNELIQRENEINEFSFVVNEDVFELSEEEIQEAQKRDSMPETLIEDEQDTQEFGGVFDMIETTENEESDSFESESCESGNNNDEVTEEDDYINNPNGYKADLAYFLGLNEENESEENNSEDNYEEKSEADKETGEANSSSDSVDGIGEVSFWKHVDIKNKITDQQKNLFISLAIILSTVFVVGLIVFVAISPVGRNWLDNLFFGNNNKTESNDGTEDIPFVPTLTPTPLLTSAPENTPSLMVSTTPTLTPTMTPTPTQSSWRPTPTPTKIIYSLLEPKHEDNIFNMLLIGVENLDDNGVMEVGSNGDADSIILVSVKQDSGEIVLCSVLRDIWVTIPGRDDAKLSYAYELGGASILEQTFETNFKVDIDAYAKFDFTAFEQVIDLLGGVDVSLTTAEAKYLNKTNYITDPLQRTVVPGIQTLTGNQALGYCRIKAVETSSGSNGDFGRTERQRNVIKALINKYKSKSITELIDVTEQILGMITTSATKEQVTEILTSIVESGSLTVEAKKIPSTGNYKVTMMKGQEALVVDFEETIPELFRYIFGDVE